MEQRSDKLRMNSSFELARSGLPGTRTKPMRVADLPSVMRIEKQAYEFPWSEGIFRDCLRIGYQCYVLESSAGEVIGYSVMSCGAAEAHVLNLCILEDYRGMGLGRSLLSAMLEAGRKNRARTVFLEVRPSNAVAIGLYLSMGFNEVGVRKSYYPAAIGREDALVLALEL